MPAKRQHTDADIAMLAAHFRETWSEGQVIRSWLRIHAEELRRLVRQEDWAWVNIGRALSLAGIAYQTGKPWTGEHLRRTLVKACATRKTQPDRKVPTQERVADAQVAVATPPPNGGEPEFRIIRRRGVANPDMPQLATPNPAPLRGALRPDLSDEEILPLPQVFP